MFMCKPERNARQTKILIAVCALVTMGFFGASVYVEKFSSLIEFAGFASLAVSILLVVRYCMTEFEYSIDAQCFSVAKTVGTRKQIICNLELDSTCALFTEQEYKKLPHSQKAIIKYSLNQNMNSACYVFVCVFNGKKTMVKFEPNAQFAAIVKAKIEEAKTEE